MSRIPETDMELVALLRSGNTTDRNSAMNRIYATCYPAIERFVTSNSGTTDDARDYFQEAIIIFYEQMLAGRKLSCKIRTYLYSIVRNLWFKKLRKGNLVDTLDDHIVVKVENEKEIYTHLSENCEELIAEAVNKVLQMMNFDQQEALGLRFFNKLKVKEVAQLMQKKPTAAAVYLQAAKKSFYNKLHILNRKDQKLNHCFKGYFKE